MWQRWMYVKKNSLFFFLAQDPLVGLEFLLDKGLQSHTNTPHSVGFLQTSDQPDDEAITWRHQHTNDSDIPEGF